MAAYRTRDYDFRPSLASAKVPIHVFVGMKSRMYPCAGQIAIRDYVPQARIVRFANAGHALLADDPVQFVGAMRAFLRDSLA